MNQFINSTAYSDAELFWYFGGFLAWTPAYVAVLVIGLRQRRLEIPVLAATGNITWEALWGFAYGGDLDMGWGLQVIYIGAFVLDAGILYFAFRYGKAQSMAPLIRRWWGLLVCGLLAGWCALIAGLEASGRDLPLGSVSAYLVNLAVSGVYLWSALTLADTRHLSWTVAWSKFIGTAMVTVFVFLRYPDDQFTIALAVVVGIIDVVYIGVLVARRRELRPETSATLPA